MELRLTRHDLTQTRTIGRLLINGLFECYTLEPALARLAPWLQHPAIPGGCYDVILQYSDRRGRVVPWLADVPGRTDIEIHTGNKAMDTLGCIIVGQSRQHDSLVCSQLALAALQPKIAGALAHGEAVRIRVEEASTFDEATSQPVVDAGT